MPGSVLAAILFTEQNNKNSYLHGACSLGRDTVDPYFSYYKSLFIKNLKSPAIARLLSRTCTESGGGSFLTIICILWPDYVCTTYHCFGNQLSVSFLPVNA